MLHPITNQELPDFALIRKLKLAAPSTISGWRKTGHYPTWVDKVIALHSENLDLRYKLLVAQHFGGEAACAADNIITPWNPRKAILDAHNYAKEQMKDEMRNL